MQDYSASTGSEASENIFRVLTAFSFRLPKAR